jgi:hypothetical protein
MNASELARVSAALQKQVTRDLSPVWGISATVDPFPSLEDLPAGYWPVVLTFRTLGVDAGIHLDEKGQPYALVEMSPSWSLTASHICLELLSDPFGNRMLAGRSPREDQGEVEFLADICDPCEHPEYAYVVNDVLVSDFCTPSFWEPASRRERYSFTGSIQAPLEVLPGGHLRWYDPATDTWWTRRVSFNGPSDVNIGRADPRKSTAREFVDAHTPHHLSSTRMSPEAFEERMGESQQQALVAARSRAYHLRTTLGTSRNVSTSASGNVLDQHGNRIRSDRRHPQVLGALLRAARGASSEMDRHELTAEEESLADEVEEITTVEDKGATYAAPAVPPVAEPAPRTEYRTVPPPLPTTPPPPVVIDQTAPTAPPPAPAPAAATTYSAGPAAVRVPPSSAPPVVVVPSMPAPSIAAPPTTGWNVNSTIAVVAIAAAVVLGVSLRTSSTSQASSLPATQPTEGRAAAATPAAQVAPPALPAQPAVTPSPATPPATAPAVAPSPPAASVEPAAATPTAIAARPAPASQPRPRVVVVSPPAAPRASRSAEKPADKPGSESLESLIDDRR